jgi:hypothetical protein
VKGEHLGGSATVYVKRYTRMRIVLAPILNCVVFHY